MITNKHKKLTITRFLKPYRIIPLSIAGIALFLFGCENNHDVDLSSGMKSEKVAMGLLTGRATRWPMSPIARNNIPSANEPADGIKLVILKPSGNEIQSVVTDKEGNYRIDLPPGTYRIEMPPSPLGWTKDLPTEVTIAENKEIRLDIRIDTGMR